jgi:hypothetical protein
MRKKIERKPVIVPMTAEERQTLADLMLLYNATTKSAMMRRALWELASANGLVSTPPPVG